MELEVLEAKEEVREAGNKQWQHAIAPLEGSELKYDLGILEEAGALRVTASELGVLLEQATSLVVEVLT